MKVKHEVYDAQCDSPRASIGCDVPNTSNDNSEENQETMEFNNDFGGEEDEISTVEETSDPTMDRNPSRKESRNAAYTHADVDRDPIHKDASNTLYTHRDMNGPEAQGF